MLQLRDKDRPERTCLEHRGRLQWKTKETLVARTYQGRPIEQIMRGIGSCQVEDLREARERPSVVLIVSACQPGFLLVYMKGCQHGHSDLADSV